MEGTYSLYGELSASLCYTMVINFVPFSVELKSGEEIQREREREREMSLYTMRASIDTQ